MKIGCWEVNESEFREFLSNHGIDADGFNTVDFSKCVDISLRDPSVGEGDPWRMGRKFHFERALEMMQQADGLPIFGPCEKWEGNDR